jgi:nucleotide-binding universal stress UspA family protein
MGMTIRRVLVPVDFGPLSAKLLDFAGAVASGPQAEVQLLHVLGLPFVTAGPYEFRLPDTPARREQLYAQARTRLSALGERLRALGLSTTTEVRMGTVSDQIVAAAIDYGADLIVMGKGRHGGLLHVLEGAISEQVGRRVTCPVMTVRDHGGTGMAAA